MLRLFSSFSFAKNLLQLLFGYVQAIRILNRMGWLYDCMCVWLYVCMAH